MAAATDINAITHQEMALANTSCRILIISSAVVQAQYFIERLQELALSKTTSIPTSSAGSSGSLLRTPGSAEPLTLPEQNRPSNGSNIHQASVKIPWTLTNRYYTADVHFAVHPTEAFSSALSQGVPALVFVWSEGESYKDAIREISNNLSQSGHEPEVMLAVRVDRNLTLAIDEEEDKKKDEGWETDGDVDTDEFLLQFGFEFINALGPCPARGSSRTRLDNDEGHGDSGIPHLPRVLDALSTIMWPSMQHKAGNGPHSRGRDLMKWAQEGSEEGILAEIDRNPTRGISKRTDNLRMELEQLAKWLEEDESSIQHADRVNLYRNDPWELATNSGQPIPARGPSLKFEDDFTVLVSAPMGGPVEHSSGSSTPEVGPDAAWLSASGGSLYNTLGSNPDLGELVARDEKDEDPAKDVTVSEADNSDDEDLPSKEEIERVRNRIFGTRTVRQDEKNGKGIGNVNDGMDDDDEEYDMSAFNLTKVLGALEQMKTEISMMEDEVERRKAAARVALGLVYGLEEEG